jgi:hypothetical protein
VPGLRTDRGIFSAMGWGCIRRGEKLERSGRLQGCGVWLALGSILRHSEGLQGCGVWARLFWLAQVIGDES